MKITITLLAVLAMTSCGMRVTYEDPKTGISVSETIGGGFRPELDFSNAKASGLKLPPGFKIEPAK